MLLDPIRATIEKYSMFSPREKVIVGVSAGPDSCCLLFALASLKEYRLKLHVAHLNHMARPQAAVDRRFVERLCRRYAFPFTAADIDVRKHAPRGSFEEAARDVRFEFLFSVARAENARTIALGHTANDQAETVLMRLIRGAGLSGLSAIAPRRCFGKYTVVRPLLQITRRQVTAYLRKRKLVARIDSSNFDDAYLRNDVRLRLLPLLEKRYNGNIVRLLSNTAASVADDYEYLRLMAERACSRLGPGIDLKRFKALHPALQRLVLRMHIERMKGDTRRITFGHIQEIEDLIRVRPIKSVVDLPGGISVIKCSSRLRFYRR